MLSELTPRFLQGHLPPIRPNIALAPEHTMALCRFLLPHRGSHHARTATAILPSSERPVAVTIRAQQWHPTAGMLTPRPASRLYSQLRKPASTPPRRLKPPPKPAPTPGIPRARLVPLLGAGLVVFGIGFYGVFLAKAVLGSAEVRAEQVPEDVSDRYDRIALHFDQETAWQEGAFGLGLKKRRRELLKLARGHVLETSVGTGRNMEYYRFPLVKTVTMVDQSAPMLEVARKKWKDKYPQYTRNVAFRTQSAIDPIPAPSPDGFDTVVQTMGLCSTPQPAELLRNMGRLAKQDGGQILLLEHGKSHYRWLNDMLDAYAPAHADRYGCWWNKDIGKIVEESGLEVVTIKRYNFGTTWWVQLRPSKTRAQEIQPADAKGADEANGGAQARVEGQETSAAGDAREATEPQRQWYAVWKR